MGASMKKNIITIFAFIATLSGYSSISIAQEDAENPKYIAACKGGNINACNLLGNRYKNGIKAEKNHTKAIRYLTKSCQAGNASGCYDLGLIYSENDGTKSDAKKTVTYFTKACDLKDASSCTQLGQMYWFGKVVSADEKKAAALFRRALKIEPDNEQVKAYLEQVESPK